MEKILTVTVPAYNAGKYLSVCLDSLCVPELIGDLDVIIINDGSADSTAEIAETYVRRYPDSIRLITKENGGHGSGINRGIREAQGFYFRVLDADDWFDKEGLKELIGFLRRSAAERCITAAPEACGSAGDTVPGPVPDLISSQFLWVLEGGSGDPASFRRKAQFSEPFPGVEYGKIYPLDEVAGKLYVKFHNLTVRTALLRENRIEMDEHCYYEDAEYALYPFAFARTVAFTEKPVYMYRIGVPGQSMSREKLLKNAGNYDLVLHSLLRFYTSLKKNGVSAGLLDYTERFIARFYAGRIKIGLSMPVGCEAKKEILSMEKDLRENYPEIFRKNENTPVRLLRASGYILYLPAALLVRLRGTV